MVLEKGTIGQVPGLDDDDRITLELIDGEGELQVSV